MKRLAALVASLALAFSLVLPAGAQAPAPPPAGEAGPSRRPPEARLPPDSVTSHVVELPGRTLRFTATAGTIPLNDGQGALQAEVGYVSYVLEGTPSEQRPVTFAFNGGPGAASAYLHLGALGPWRLPLEGSTISPSKAPELVLNAETWLDFTDLVFVDPVGTGYSRGIGSPDDVRNRYFSVEGDIASLSDAVLRWLKSKDRLQSPKFFVGESYGGFRGPLIVQKLQADHGIGFSGLVLVSPVLDFAWRNGSSLSPMQQASRLPSLAAAALERRGPVGREALHDVERYAGGEFLADFAQGVRDPAAVERLSRRVATLTGLDAALVRRLAGRIDMRTFQREGARASGRVASAYDTGVEGWDPEPNAANPRFEDPLLTGLTAPLTSAMVDHLARRLNYKPEGRYHLLNGGVNGAWRWGSGRGQPEAVSELRQAVALDPNLRVLVVHGLTDLVTPYFENELILRQLPQYGPERRIELAAYPGGHMFYSRDVSRGAFRADAERLFEAALKARSQDRVGE